MDNKVIVLRIPFEVVKIRQCNDGREPFDPHMRLRNQYNPANSFSFVIAITDWTNLSHCDEHFCYYVIHVLLISDTN